MLKLGTHNSMTYLKPTDPIQVLAWTTGKCQNLSLEEQYEFGVRLFDLRIRFDEGAKPYFAHGLLEFHEKAVTDVLAFLNQKQDCIVNLVMESFGKIKDSQDHLFIDFCKQAEDQYKYVTFVGGWSKYPESGHYLYSFASKGKIPETEVYKVFTLLNEGIRETTEIIKKSEGDLKKSLKKIVLGGLELLKSPVFFAWQNNPNYWKKVNEDVYTMMDFVQLGAPEDYISQLPVKLQEKIKVLFDKLPSFDRLAKIG